MVLTGDIHTNYVYDIKVDFDKSESSSVATDFVDTSVTSGGEEKLYQPYSLGMTAETPWLKFHNAERGDVSCTVTPQGMAQ